MLRRRLIDLEKEMKDMRDRMGMLEREVDVLKTEKEVWKNLYNDLHKQVTLNEEKAEDTDVM